MTVRANTLKKVSSPQQTALVPMQLFKLTLSSKSDLNAITVTYHITPVNRSGDVTLQMFVHRKFAKSEEWTQLNPTDAMGKPLVVSLYKGMDNTGTFTFKNMLKGEYTEARLMLFQSGTYNLLYDSNKDTKALSFNVSVTSGETRIIAPMLEISNETKVTANDDGTHTVLIDGVVNVPANYKSEEGAFFVMAKGDGGFDQQLVEMKNAVSASNATNPHLEIPVHLTLHNAKPGLWNMQFGLYNRGFDKQLQWLWPGIDYEVGGDQWVQKASGETIPPRLHVRNRRFVTLAGKPYDFYGAHPESKKAVSFARGGNYGNAITWTIHPELNRPGYFTLLKELGCKFIRFNFNPDRYPKEALYQHAVDQIVQNIWAAGLYPIIAPQDLPKGDTLQERVDKGLQVARTMAAKYAGKSVWLELCNEPHEFTSWAAWKPVAIRYIQAIRKIDPEAFVIVPFENYGFDGREAAQSPITEVAVDLYDGHAYLKPEDIVPHYGSAIAAGLPVLIGEYGGGNPAYLTQIDHALQSLPPGLMAAGPWAFTIAGQDSLPLVTNGATATLQLTPAGQAIATDYATWDAGNRLK